MCDDNIEEIEGAILDKTAEIWNMFITLEQTHPSDIDDMTNAIHNIQKIIAIRIARRVKQDKFVTINTNKRRPIKPRTSDLRTGY